jgi:hypothetical protein
LTIFNILIAEQPHQDDAHVILGRLVLARGAANIVASFSSGTRVGGAEDFWLIFTLLRVTMHQNSSVTQIASLVSWVLTPDMATISSGV